MIKAPKLIQVYLLVFWLSDSGRGLVVLTVRGSSTTIYDHELSIKICLSFMSARNNSENVMLCVLPVHD